MIQMSDQKEKYQRAKEHAEKEYSTFGQVFCPYLCYRVIFNAKGVEDGPKFFWSIIPFWRTSTTNGERILHNGQPEED